MGIEEEQTQSSSSIDSSNHPCGSFCRKSSSSINTMDLSTDLRLGLSIFPSSQPHSSLSSSFTLRNWPPIKSTFKSNLVEKRRPSLYVKVYMEGSAIGRKLNLLAHHSYDELVKALGHMFRTIIILCPNTLPLLRSGNFHVLTYKDQEGDWMMVGDVPWEMFLKSGVKRLKITRADRC